jgi:hypothetical protein
MAAVGRPGGKILVDDDALLTDGVFAGSESGAANCVGYDKRAIEPAAVEIVAKRDKRNVNAVGDETDVEMFGQA